MAPRTAVPFEMAPHDATPIEFAALGLDKRLIAGVEDRGFVRTNPRSWMPAMIRLSRPSSVNSMGVASCGATSNGTAVRGATATGGR